MSLAFEVYTPDKKNRHEITHATSVSMDRLYNGIGKISLAVSADDYNIQTIQQGSVLLDTRTDTSYIICNPKYDTTNNVLTANGYTANWLLNHRCLSSESAIKNVVSGCYGLVRQNLRGLPAVSVAEDPVEDTTTEAVAGPGQLLDCIIPILDEKEMGHRMVWDDESRSFRFEIYKGRDLTQGIHAAVFSELQGTARNLVCNLDDSTFKNVFYILVQFSDKSTRIIQHGALDAPDRRELWINNKTLQGSKDSREAALQKAHWKCQQEAEKRLKRQNFSVNIDPNELGTAYDLGDKVVCVSERLGISFTARITGVSYRMDINGQDTSIVLGEPTLTAIDEVILEK